MIEVKPDVRPDGIYTVAQAAKALRVDRHTLINYIDKGLIDSSVRKFDKKRVLKGQAIITLWEEMEE